MNSGSWRSFAVDTFLLFEKFVNVSEGRRLEAFLDTVPVDAPGATDPTQRFAFSHPIYDDVIVTGRLEAAAGRPISIGGRLGEGLPMPMPLRTLRDAVEEALRLAPLAKAETEERLTSMYVDRYDAGGTFVPHTDRDCYGPVIAGVSLGRGTARLTFFGPRSTFDVTVPPCSLYFFSGPIRSAPWTHAVTSITDRRYAITFRSDARSADLHHPARETPRG
jgi:hypothetical protein